MSDSKSEKGKGRLVFSPTVDDLKAAFPNIPDQPGKRLMTFEELQGRIGNKPKNDLLGGLISMSTRFKALGTALEDLRLRVDTVDLQTLADDRPGFEADIKQRADQIRTAAQAYRDNHDKKLFRKAKHKRKRDAVDALLEDLASFQVNLPAMLDRVLQDRPDPWPDNLPVTTAMALTKAKLKPAQLRFCQFDEFNDRRETAPATELGGGEINKPFRLTYGDTKMVFKEETGVENKQPHPAAWIDIDFKDPRYGARNIATGQLGKFLGTDVVPPACFAVHDGKAGLLMNNAPGNTPRVTIGKRPDGSNKYEVQCPWQGRLTPKALVSLQQQLNELEVSDILSGQADRHPGNYLVDVKGDAVTVTGIDNDFAFGSYGADEDQPQVPLVRMGIMSVKNMPLLIGRQMADRLIDGSFDDDLAPLYADLLNPTEIEAAEKRFDALRKHVQTLEATGCVVDDWATWSKDGMSATEYLKAGKGNGSLFNRDLAKFT